MGLNATYTKKISIPEGEVVELHPETFAANGKMAACIFDGIKTSSAVTNLQIRFRDTDEWFPWATTEFLQVRAQSIYVRMSTGTADVTFMARIIGIQMSNLYD